MFIFICSFNREKNRYVYIHILQSTYIFLCSCLYAVLIGRKIGMYTYILLSIYFILFLYLYLVFFGGKIGMYIYILRSICFILFLYLYVVFLREENRCIYVYTSKYFFFNIYIYLQF
jgi:hypothetical protein